MLGICVIRREILLLPRRYDVPSVPAGWPVYRSLFQQPRAIYDCVVVHVPTDSDGEGFTESDDITVDEDDDEHEDGGMEDLIVSS